MKRALHCRVNDVEVHGTLGALVRVLTSIKHFAPIVCAASGYALAISEALFIVFLFVFASAGWQARCDVGPQCQLDVHLRDVESAARVHHPRRVPRLPLGVQTARRQQRIGYAPRSVSERFQYRGASRHR